MTTADQAKKLVRDRPRQERSDDQRWQPHVRETAIVVEPAMRQEEDLDVVVDRAQERGPVHRRVGVVDRIVEAHERSVSKRLPVHGQSRDHGDAGGKCDADERRTVPEVDCLDREVDPGVDRKGGMRVDSKGEPQTHQRAAPSRAAPGGVPSGHRQRRTSHSHQRVGVAARAELARIAGCKETREPAADQARLAILVSEVEPHVDRHEKKESHVQQVVAQTVTEDRHRHKGHQGEVLCDVGRGRISAEQPPVPTDEHTTLQQCHAVRRLRE